MLNLNLLDLLLIPLKVEIGPQILLEDPFHNRPNILLIVGPMLLVVLFLKIVLIFEVEIQRHLLLVPSGDELEPLLPIRLSLELLLSQPLLDE